MPKTILVVDDVRENREFLCEALAAPGYQFSEAENASQALEKMRSQPADLVLTDERMPGISGVDLLKKLHSEYPDTLVIVVTAFGTVESAVEAMKAGARDYITRPLDVHALRLVVQRVLAHPAPRTEVRTPRRAMDKRYGFENLLGRSPALLEVLDQAARVAPTNSTVLILGETGTGKELLARGVHSNSSRCAGPFITVNCGAIPRDLLESELFGHVRGSFTGALKERRGKAEAAHGGTLFLDEIGEMSSALCIARTRAFG